MDNRSQLSPPAAWAMGIAFVACGLPPLLIATGVITLSQPPGDNAPLWVVACAGLMFVGAGLAIVIDYGIARVATLPNGDFAPSTPIVIRVANLLLGGVIVGCLTAVFGWVAFGRGPRHFSTTLYIPLLGVPLREQSGELSGRIMFGAVAVLMGLMFVACTTVGILRLYRSLQASGGRSRAPSQPSSSP